MPGKPIYPTKPLSSSAGRTEYSKVASAHFAAKSKGQPTSLNLDKPYPARVFTLIVRGADRGKFYKPPETRCSGKKICATGVTANLT
ncbi:MAG: hypothetical protein WAN11_13205 [Syntrophobacteraceae bacterium]